MFKIKKIFITKTKLKGQLAPNVLKIYSKKISHQKGGLNYI
jgi:hypothetical protein